MTKSIFGKFRKLEKKKKLQLVIAVSLSAVLLVALPVYAWFTHNRSIALTTKINAPPPVPAMRYFIIITIC